MAASCRAFPPYLALCERLPCFISFSLRNSTAPRNYPYPHCPREKGTSREVTNFTADPVRIQVLLSAENRKNHPPHPASISVAQPVYTCTGTSRTLSFQKFLVQEDEDPNKSVVCPRNFLEIYLSMYPHNRLLN